MKKIISLLLIVVMLFCMSIATFAANVNGSVTSQYYDIADGMVVSEFEGDNYAIVRKATKVGTSGNSTMGIDSQSGDESFHEEKELLSILGLKKSVIDNLSSEELQDTRDSLMITTVQQYSKVNENGEIVYMPQDQALAEVAAIRAKGITITDESPYSDQYMKITVAAETLSGAKVKIFTTAEWLTDPFFRGKDTIGACAKYVTVLNSSRCGYLQYTHETRTQNGDLISREPKQEIKFKDFQNASNGSFYGAGANFDLPNDTYGPSAGVYEEVYTDFLAYFSYEGHVEFPDQAMYFNITGTYTHTEIAITFNPSLSVSISGGSGSIAPSVMLNKRSRTAQIEVNYNP